MGDSALALQNEEQFRASVLKRRKTLEFAQKILSLTAGSSPLDRAILPVDSHHSLRRLYPTEIETLQNHCACTCSDWSKTFLLLSTPGQATLDQSQNLRRLVTRNHFEGTVVLGVGGGDAPPPNKKNPLAKLPIGIHNNALIGPNAIVSSQSWVTHNTLVRDTLLFPGCVLAKCGSVTASKKDQWLHKDAQLELTVGAESGGGRDLLVQPEADMMDVCQQLTGRKTNQAKKLPAPSTKNEVVVPNVNVISPHCIVRDTPTLQGIYLEPNASIQAASSVANALLMEGACLKNACTVSDVHLQWKAAITESSNVTETLLMEEAHIGPNSLVASSILGPDVHVSAGEVHCSVIGPNTNAHHQSLVISVLWPLGRGNVGYGANIGSNHTGRIPDQETSSGEGVFWGLSCVIKFPVDMTLAPYSIVAAGTTLPPQRVCMPFSLIVSSNTGGANSIIPGWVLASSPYTIARSEKKFANRRKAKRHLHYTGWKIVRPETIAMCQWARKQLQSVPQESETYATDKAIAGIGSNVLSEKGRRSGIKAYTDCIHRFALGGLLEWWMQQSKNGAMDMSAIQREFIGSLQTSSLSKAMETTYKQVDWPLLPWETSTSDQLWQFRKKILMEEFPMKGGVDDWATSLLQTLVKLEKANANNIYKCKQRDDQRGAKTVPGYAASHKAAEIDPVVTEARARAEEVEALVGQCVNSISKTPRSRL